MSGRLLKGRYELQSVLGRGLATTTHLALDRQTGRRCVVKVLPVAEPEALKAHELLMREARVLQRLDHPRIPKLVDFFSEEEGPETRVCLVQQHVDGKSLLDLVRAGRRFGEREALALGVKIARVLEYLHGFDPPILHRDVKPANVLLTRGERVHLVDFGAVRDHLAPELFHPGGPTVVGTRGYMPYEQFEGRAVPGSDLYALGATLVFALSGKEPAELGNRGLRLDVGSNVAVSPGFERLLSRLLEPDWRDRPLSVTEVREELERLAEEARKPARPRRAPPRATVVLAALAVAAGLLVALRSLAPPRAPSVPSLAPPAAPLAPGRLPAEEGPPAVPAEPEPSPAEPAPPPRRPLRPGRDVASLVSVEERAGFTVHRFHGELATVQTLDLDLGPGAVWVGTSRGLLRHDLPTGGFELWDEAEGLPGARLDEIAVAGGRVFVDSSTPSGKGSVRGTGTLELDVAGRSWSALRDVSGVWDLWGDGSTLWVGTGDGAFVRDLQTGAVRHFTRSAGELVHDAVHAVRRHGDTVAFAALGDWVEGKKDFEGGGLTLWDRGRNRFRSYTTSDGLVRDYSCDVFLDDAEIFVAHWEEELGLSCIDRRTGDVEAVRRSVDGADLGGVVLAGDARDLWIGQQGALVRLDRETREATVLREGDGLPGYIVSAIAVAEDAVWASVYGYGQDRVRTAGLVRFPRR